VVAITIFIAFLRYEEAETAMTTPLSFAVQTIQKVQVSNTTCLPNNLATASFHALSKTTLHFATHLNSLNSLANAPREFTAPWKKPLSFMTGMTTVLLSS
jgi:hypothetical protein